MTHKPTCRFCLVKCCNGTLANRNAAERFFSSLDNFLWDFTFCSRDWYWSRIKKKDSGKEWLTVTLKSTLVGHSTEWDVAIKRQKTILICLYEIWEQRCFHLTNCNTTVIYAVVKMTAIILTTNVNIRLYLLVIKLQIILTDVSPACIYVNPCAVIWHILSCQVLKSKHTG